MGKLKDWTITSLKENRSSGNRSCIFWPLCYHSFETESRIRSQSRIFVQNLSFSLMLYTFSCQQKVKFCSPSKAAVATGWAQHPCLLLHPLGAGLVAGVGALALNAALPDLSQAVLSVWPYTLFYLLLGCFICLSYILWIQKSNIDILDIYPMSLAFFFFLYGHSRLTVYQSGKRMYVLLRWIRNSVTKNLCKQTLKLLGSPLESIDYQNPKL